MTLRILMPIIQFYPLIGGAEQQAQRLAKSLVSRGNEVIVLTGWWDRNIPQQENIDGIHVYRNNTRWKWLARFGRLNILRQYVYEASLLWFLWSKRKSYDIIHVHQALHAAVFSTVAAGLLGKRIIIKVGCGGPLSDLKMMKGCRVSPFGEFFWKIIKRCDRIVAINAEIEEELLNDGFARQQVVRIPNGIASLNVPTKSTYGIKASIRFVSVGRLDPQKGYDVLLTAINLLSQQVEFQFECNIFGGGKEATKLEELIEEYGLQETVFLRGIVNDVQDRLHRMDIFIQASRAEGLSNALMEAMAAGLPCIATKIGGNSDLLNPEGVGEKIPAGEFLVCENGILVNPDDEIGLKKAIVFLASADDNLRQTLGMRAGRWIREHCCLERVTDRYLELYEELLTAKRRTLC